MKEFVYYEKNVQFPIGVRMFLNDSAGVLLTNVEPFIAVDVENLRDFKLANKRLIIEGLIKPTEAPDLDWDTPNTISDEEVTQLLKNTLKLKSKLEGINSYPIVNKFLLAAQEQNKSPKTLELIKTRLDELAEDAIEPDMMQGIE